MEDEIPSFFKELGPGKENRDTERLAVGKGLPLLAGKRFLISGKIIPINCDREIYSFELPKNRMGYETVPIFFVRGGSVSARKQAEKNEMRAFTAESRNTR